MFVVSTMEVPGDDWPSHTQSVERCVKMVTEAASYVYSQERTEVYIMFQVISRELMSKNRSKMDISKLLKFKNENAKKKYCQLVLSYSNILFYLIF